MPLATILPNWKAVSWSDHSLLNSSILMFSLLCQAYGWPDTFVRPVSDLCGFKKLAPYESDRVKIPDLQREFLQDWLQNDPGFLFGREPLKKSVFTWGFAVEKRFEC